MPKTDIFIEDYSPKSFVVLGNTKIYKDDIKRLGGKFNQNLSGNRVGWIFPTSLKDKVTAWISGDEKIPEKTNNLEATLQKILKNQEIILNLLKKSGESEESDSESESNRERSRIPRLLSRN